MVVAAGVFLLLYLALALVISLLGWARQSSRNSCKAAIVNCSSHNCKSSLAVGSRPAWLARSFANSIFLARISAIVSASVKRGLPAPAAVDKRASCLCDCRPLVVTSGR